MAKAEELQPERGYERRVARLYLTDLSSSDSGLGLSTESLISLTLLDSRQGYTACPPTSVDDG